MLTVEEEAAAAKRNAISDQFSALVSAESKQFSLPPSIKSQVENSTGASTTLQMFNQVSHTGTLQSSCSHWHAVNKFKEQYELRCAMW